MFQRTQNDLRSDPSATLRQLSIPSGVALFAKSLRMYDNRSREDKATLPDIYLGLAQEGATLVLSGQLESAVFTEPQKAPGSTSVQIAFPEEFYGVLGTFKEKLEEGSLASFGVTLEGYEISLIGLAVRLMEIAVEQRQGNKKRSTKKTATDG